MKHLDKIKGTLLFSHLRLREKGVYMGKPNPAAVLRIIPGWVWGAHRGQAGPDCAEVSGV